MFGVGTIGTAYPNFDISTLVSGNECCNNITYSITSATNATYTGTLPNIVVTPTDTAWSIVYEACCDDGTCASGTLEGTANCVANVTADDEDYDVTFGVGTVNVDYPSFNMVTLITADACCSATNTTITSAVGATYVLNWPNIVVTPTAATWSITYESCCVAPNTGVCDSGTLSGTACIPSITAGDENFD